MTQDRAVRRVPLTLPTDAAFCYVETTRPVLPRDRDTFETTRAIGDRLAEETGYAFAGVARDDKARALTPSWLDVRDYAFDSTNRIGVSASLAHGMFGLPAAFDLGARDARNAFDWGVDDWGSNPRGWINPPHHLFLGDAAEEWLEMVEVAGSVISADYSPDRSSIAFHEFWGSMTYAVSIADATTGERRFLTSIDTAGFGSLRWSADGRWLLLGRFLIDPETGRHVELPIKEYASATSWWAALSPSTIMVLDQRPVLDERQPGDPEMLAFDLATARVEAMGPIRLPPEPDLAPALRLLADVEIARRGDYAICGSRFGLPPGFWHWGAPGNRATLVDLAARTVDVVVEPLLDTDIPVEREHSAFRWLDRPEPAEVTVAPELLESAQPAYDALTSANRDYVASNARDIVTYGLQTMLGGEPAAARPDLLYAEVLRALAAIRVFAPMAHRDVFRWVDEATAMTSEMAASGSFSPAAAEGWRRFARAWAEIKANPAGYPAWASDRFGTAGAPQRVPEGSQS